MEPIAATHHEVDDGEDRADGIMAMMMVSFIAYRAWAMVPVPVRTDDCCCQFTVANVKPTDDEDGGFRVCWMA